MPVVQASNGCKLFSRSHALLASTLRSSSMAGWPHSSKQAHANFGNGMHQTFLPAWYVIASFAALWKARLQPQKSQRGKVIFWNPVMKHPAYLLRPWLLPLHHTWPKQAPFEDMLCPFGDDRRLGPPATKAGTSNLRLNL